MNYKKLIISLILILIVLPILIVLTGICYNFKGVIFTAFFVYLIIMDFFTTAAGLVLLIDFYIDEVY